MKLIIIIAIHLLLYSDTLCQVTFNKNIAPIIYQHCYPCHHKGGAAPFELSTYNSVAKRSKFIEYVTENKIMPPWKANPSYHTFADERVLSSKEIALIKEWIQLGLPEGKKKDKPVLPSMNSGSILLQAPDLTVKMKEPLKVRGDNKPVYVCYKIPYEIEKDTFVRGIEFVPSQRSVVHHASYQILEVPDNVDTDLPPYYFYYSDTINGINDKHDYETLNLISLSGEFPREVFHAGWLPGTSPLFFQGNVGFRLPKKGVILIRNLHLSPTPESMEEVSEFNFYFSEAEQKREVQFAAFRPTKYDSIIEAGAVKENRIIIRINSSMSLLAINPHMHLLGRYCKVYALNPMKDTIKLIEIPRWDFNWQDFYRYKHPVIIPKGSTIVAEAIFDNTTNNINNPNHPPKDLRFESGSMNDDVEMMRLVFLYLPYQKGDEEIE